MEGLTENISLEQGLRYTELTNRAVPEAITHHQSKGLLKKLQDETYKFGTSTTGFGISEDFFRR